MTAYLLSERNAWQTHLTSCHMQNSSYKLKERMTSGNTKILKKKVHDAILRVLRRFIFLLQSVAHPKQVERIARKLFNHNIKLAKNWSHPFLNYFQRN